MCFQFLTVRLDYAWQAENAVSSSMLKVIYCLVISMAYAAPGVKPMIGERPGPLDKLGTYNCLVYLNQRLAFRRPIQSDRTHVDCAAYVGLRLGYYGKRL